MTDPKPGDIVRVTFENGAIVEGPVFRDNYGTLKISRSHDNSVWTALNHYTWKNAVTEILRPACPDTFKEGDEVILTMDIGSNDQRVYTVTGWEYREEWVVLLGGLWEYPHRLVKYEKCPVPVGSVLVSKTNPLKTITVDGWEYYAPTDRWEYLVGMLHYNPDNWEYAEEPANMSVVIDNAGWAWQKTADGRWHSPDGVSYGWNELLRMRGRVTKVHP